MPPHSPGRICPSRHRAQALLRTSQEASPRIVSLLLACVLTAVLPLRAHALIGGSDVWKQDDVVTKQVRQSLATLFTMDGHPFCTGFQIESDIVLTAAHCLGSVGYRGKPKERMKVRLCESEKKCQYINVKSVTGHQKYKDAAGNSVSPYDIALIKLAKKRDNGPKIAIPSRGPSTQYDQILYGAGGTHPDEKKSRAGHMSSVNMITYGLYTSENSPDQFNTAMNEDKATCPGDSGGPSFSMIDGELTLSGINIGANDKCGVAKLGILTSTYFHRHWINENLAKLSDSSEFFDGSKDVWTSSDKVSPIVRRHLATLINEKGRVFCSGVQVADDVVLTAANCIASKRISSINVRFCPEGMDQCTTVSAGALLAHPKYSSAKAQNSTNNLALVKLSKQRPLKWYTPLPYVSPDRSAYQTAYSASTRDAGRGSSKIVLRLGKQDENARSPDIHDGTYTLFMTGDLPSCPQDSGGPVYSGFPPELVGINVTNADKCRMSSTRTIVDLLPHREWIKDGILELELAGKGAALD